MSSCSDQIPYSFATEAGLFNVAKCSALTEIPASIDRCLNIDELNTDGSQTFAKLLQYFRLQYVA